MISARQLPRLLVLGFAALAITGALLASGRLGEGGLQTAIGITLLVTGALGVLNTLFFVRLKRALDQMAASPGGERQPPPTLDTGTSRAQD